MAEAGSKPRERRSSKRESLWVFVATTKAEFPARREEPIKRARPSMRNESSS
jgi:hypothetical protein